MHSVETLILVTGFTEAPYLSAIAAERFPSIRAVHAPDKATLKASIAELRESVGTARLVTIATDIIVPASILQCLPTRGYNFHAGPPAYPGSHPASFAIYERAETFGVTLHELAPAIDTGRIVDVERFAIGPDAIATDLNGVAYAAVMRMFSKWLDSLLNTTDDLLFGKETWAGPARTRAEAARLADLDTGSDPVELDRRKRAFSLIR